MSIRRKIKALRYQLGEWLLDHKAEKNAIMAEHYYSLYLQYQTMAISLEKEKIVMSEQINKLKKELLK